MRYLTALTLTLFALLIAGCGDDDDTGDGLIETTTTEESAEFTKDDFIEQADAICQEGNDEFRAINDDLDAITGGTASEQLAEAEPLLRQGAAVVDERIDEFRALTPPPGDEEIIDRYLDAVEDQRTYLEQMADAAANDDLEEFQQTNERLQQVAAERRGIAQGYGFEVCGSE